MEFLEFHEKMVGAVRFELTTSCTRNKRASQATLRPEPRAGESARCPRELQSGISIEMNGGPDDLFQRRLSSRQGCDGRDAIDASSSLFPLRTLRPLREACRRG